MKLVTYSKNNTISPGILTDERIIDIRSLCSESDPPRSIKHLLQKGPSCLEKLAKLADSATETIPLVSVKLLAPIPRPSKVLALAGNYSKHIAEVGLQLGLSESPRLTSVPRPFLMPPTVINGPDAIIPWPSYSEQVDYELELAIVIGKNARNLTPENAQDCIAGYMIANDVSARSVTFKKERDQRPWDEFYDWLNGKWSDGFLPVGPYILTADEIEDVGNLNMQLSVNGKIRQQAETSQMIFSPNEIVSFVSYIMTLEPGDIIATGTPAGVAAATGDFLEPGDKIECKIEKLGTLKNQLGQKPEKFYTPLVK